MITDACFFLASAQFPVVSGWVDLEFEDPWSLPGFLHLTVLSSLCTDSKHGELRVLRALQSLTKEKERFKPAMALGTSRRFLVQPVLKH